MAYSFNFSELSSDLYEDLRRTKLLTTTEILCTRVCLMGKLPRMYYTMENNYLLTNQVYSCIKECQTDKWASIEETKNKAEIIVNVLQNRLAHKISGSCGGIWLP